MGKPWKIDEHGEGFRMILLGLNPRVRKFVKWIDIAMTSWGRHNGEDELES